MNNINITVNLSEEDRARLDKIIEKLDRFTPPTVTISAPSAVDDELRKQLERVVASATEAAAEHAADDPLRKQLEQAIASATEAAAEPAETPQDATEAPTATDAPTEAEASTTEAPAAQEAVKVTLGDIQGKVIALVQAGRKAEVRAICTAYAPQVTMIPEEKFGEVMAKLNALEG